MAGAAAFALVSGTALPLLLAAGLELIYLSTRAAEQPLPAPGPLLEIRGGEAQAEMSLSAMFHELPPEMRNRYANARRVCRTIRENYARLSVHFADLRSARWRTSSQGLLAGLPPAALCRVPSIASTCADRLASRSSARSPSSRSRSRPDSPKVQEINRKRIEILTKRLEKYDKIKENCEVIDAQCAAIEDVLQLIRDQSVTMRDPQQVSDQLDGLVQDVEQTEETVREVEAIFDLTSPEAGVSPVCDLSRRDDPRTGAQPHPELTWQPRPPRTRISMRCPTGRGSSPRNTTRARSRCSCSTATCATSCRWSAATRPSSCPCTRFLRRGPVRQARPGPLLRPRRRTRVRQPAMQDDFQRALSGYDSFTAPTTRRACRAIPTAC